jgi:cellulose synthase/poly-beta-1,6-N-acetylglucosamine synthase-like glycosyltransferase
MQQHYPLLKLEIIIVSDGSTDATDELILELIEHVGCNKKMGQGRPIVKLIRCNESKGKPNALNRGMHAATGEYVVFTDARQEFAPQAIKELIANFSDSQVGCVSGELVFLEDSNSIIQEEMGFYWRLEKQIRRMESATYSVAGVTGAIYAIRRSLFIPIPNETLLDDVFIPMAITFQGYRTIYDGQAIAFDRISKDFAQEKRRKVRTLLGNYQLIKLLPQLLSPTANPIFFRFLSHKIFRLFIPFFFIIFLVSSFFAEGIFYKMVLICTILLLFLPVIGKKTHRIPFIAKLGSLSRAFVTLNYFALIAFFLFVRPGKKNVW